MTLPKGIRIISDTLAILQDLNNSRNMFHLISLRTNSYLASFGHEGRAADEISAFAGWSLYNDELLILDNAGKLIKYKMKEPFENFTGPATIIPVDPQALPCGAIYQMPDSSFLALRMSGDKRINILDKTGALKSKLFEIESTQKFEDPFSLPALWQSSLACHPESHCVAIATRLGEIIDIYDLSSRSLRKRIAGKGGEPQMAGHSFGKIDGYKDLVITEGHIYALFSGLDRSGLTDDSPIGAQNIQVFDLQGNLLYRFYTDIPVNGIAIDEKNSRIYATNANGNIPLAVFDIPATHLNF